MKRLIIIALLFAAPLTACGQANVDRNPLPYTIGKVTLTRPQQVLNNTNYMSLTGIGRKESVLKAATSVTGRFVTNAAYGSGGSTNHSISNITLDGDRYADNGGSYTAATEVADGIDIVGIGLDIDKVIVKEFWGSAVVLRSDQYIGNARVENSLTGIEVVSSDITIGPKCIVSGCRDYGLYVHGSVGNVHSIGNHYYGHERACYVLSGGYWATDDMYADSTYGLYLETTASHIDNCTFQHNATANIYMTGPGMQISDCLIDVQRVTNWSDLAGNTYGVYFDSAADASRYDGGTINLTTFVHGSSTATGDPVTAIFCAADQVYINCNIHDNNTSDVTKGLVISGAVNGITFRIRTAGAAGFHDAADQIVVVDNAAADSIYGEIWIAGRTSKAINDYVTLPVGWDGQITVYDVDAGGAATVMTGPTAY